MNLCAEVARHDGVASVVYDDLDLRTIGSYSRCFTWAVGPLRVREKDFLHSTLLRLQLVRSDATVSQL